MKIKKNEFKMKIENKIMKKIAKEWSNESQIGYTDLAMKEAIRLGIEEGKKISYKYYFEGMEDPHIIGGEDAKRFIQKMEETEKRKPTKKEIKLVKEIEKNFANKK